MSIIVIASKLAEAVATDITTSWIIKKGRNLLGLNEDQFIITLRGLINDTILEFDKNHKIENEGKNFPFYHSKPIIETLIDIKLIGYDNVDIKELKNKINEYPNIIKPTIYQLEIFIALFEQKCRDNSTLKKHQFNDNYKYAIFSILETLDQLNSTVNSVLKEINTSLKTEYFVQLEEIQENIYSFKPKTALERLNKLEKRVEQNGQLTNIIESKICYLKGVCLQEEKNNLAAEYLIKSYLKYTNNTIKSEAAIAYLNINDLANAQKLSEEILKEEPYNINGWVVKILLDKENFIENLKNVPALVIAKRGFALNMIRHMKRTLNFNDDQITDLGIKIPVLDGENLTYFNRVTFELVIEHQLSNYFGSGVQFKYDELGKVYYTNIEKLKNILKLLDNFFSKIDNTEISDVFIELKFFQIMINHLTGKEKQDAEKFKKIYYAIKGNLPIYDILYSQYLADCGDIENAIDILSKSQHESIIYLQLIYYYRVQKKSGAVNQLVDKYINSINIVDFSTIYNVKSFLLCLMPDLQTIKSAYENIINQKTFENQLIKELFTHTIEVCYFIEGLDKKNIIDRLLKLNDNFNEHIEIKAHICQLLFLLEAYSECSKIITPMFDKNTYSELGFLYARATYRSNTNLQELLLYFKGLRVNNNKSPFEFLALEYNIRINISDYENIIDICWRGIEQYPDIEEFHSNLLNALANKNQIDNIQKYLNTNYKNDYENEETGLIACRSLQKTGYKKQAAEILYNLSIKIQNSKSRTYYLTLLEFPDGFLSEYDVVENSSYIKIQNGDDTKLLKVNSKDHNQYIGKNLNDTVLINKRGLEFESYSITRIMNAHLFLLEQIMEEAATGNSNLGVEILNFTQNGNIDFKAFEKYFIDRFGVENELQNVKRAKKLDNYYLGKENFSMICRNVFNENLLEAYLFLCQNQFVALSKTANSQISLFPDNIYVLDFTSLILFSDLKADYSITFGTKFRISPNLIKLLRDQHLILKSEKNEKMSLAVSENKVKKILYPDDFNQKILSLYEKIFAFIDSECIEYIIEEEVDLITEFKRKNEQDTYFNYLMDNCLMCSNLKFILISNDTFIIDAFQNIDRYIISPERFINTFGNDDTNLKALNYYIQKKYVGVSINSTLLYDNYINLVANTDNNFNICLLNLKYKFSVSVENAVEAINFLKNVYTGLTLIHNDKKRLSQIVFINILDGCFGSKEIVLFLRDSIIKEFSLLGDAGDEILDSLYFALSIYIKKQAAAQSI